MTVSCIGFFFLVREILKGGLHTSKSRKRLNQVKSSSNSAYTDLLYYSTHPLYANLALKGHESFYKSKVFSNKSNTITNTKPKQKNKKTGPKKR